MSDDSVTLGQLFAEYEKTSSITVLPDGKHKLRVTSCTARNKGVCPVYTPIEGPSAGKRCMAGGIYPGDSEGGRQAFFRKLEKFGLNKEFFNQNPTLKDVADALVGRVVELDLTVGSWGDEPRNELAFGIKLLDGGSTPSVAGIPNVSQTTAAPVVPEVPTVGAPPVVTESFAGGGTATVVVDDDPGF